MLHPRVVGSWQFLVAIWIALVATFPLGATNQSPSDGVYVVEPTPALKLNDEADLTTVLLVNNENRAAAHGRYLNVKPAVGLLTSTARTFIQEGVTTEYATQVLGTTLDNGRLYAQLLKKSSRVLYDKDTLLPASTVSTVTGKFATSLFNPQRSILQSHNDLVADQDWQLIDDHLLADPKSNLNTYVRNTDFIAPIDNPRGALLVFPTRSHMVDQNSQSVNKENNELAVLPYLNTAERKTEPLLDRWPNETFSISKSSSSATSRNGGGQKIIAQKVQPAANLPTFTVKNVFAPSGFFLDSNGDSEKKYDRMEEKSEYRSPKVLYHKIADEERIFSTVTYYGFADFTTIVGDTIIVFSPSTSTKKINPEYITSIKGEATLGAQEVSHVTPVPITVTLDVIEPTFTLQTLASISPFEEEPTDMKVTTGPENEEDIARDRDQNQDHDQEQDTEVTSPENLPEEEAEIEEVEQTTALQKETTLSNYEDQDTTEESPIQGPGLNELKPSMVVIEETISSDRTPVVSESSTIKMLSTPSNEDILKIYASLASAEAAKKILAEESQRKQEREENVENEKAVVEPEIKIFGGATTIFFEDDPFQAFETSKVSEQSTVQPTQVTTTEKSRETDGETELDLTTEHSSGALDITTIEDKMEGLEGDATNESREGTTAQSIEKENTNETQCSQSGEVLWSEQTKTLTYLTTFFIPGEGDDTSTSIESNVVTTVETISSTKSNCAMVSTTLAPSTTSQAVDIQTKLVDVLEKPQIEEDGETTYLVKTKAEATLDEMTEVAKQIPEQETTSTTTPLVMVTEKSHTTERIIPTADEDGPVEEEDEEDDEEQDSEDEAQQSGEEIELIYKTLYTTYTYLTTFFHDSTTSISSRKEIVTNVVTSTISPSMYRTDLDVTDILSSMTIQPTGLLKDNEVSPTTSVGVGRPTTKFVVPQSDLVQIDDILREDINTEATEILSDGNVAQNGVKTLYTTYTYYTTIFADGETEVMSRTEVHTNYISGAATEISPTAQRKVVLDTVSDEDNAVLDIKPTASYETIRRISAPAATENASKLPEQAEVEKIPTSYNTFTRADNSEAFNKPSEVSSQTGEDGGVVTMVTDVRSSSSDGDRRIIENINKQWNGLLEDQISSESNTEDILPSPTLLLQTSYTTFTFYTTMYSGTATNVVSRLETVTNVVTETLQPTHTANSEDATLPITYFTTFTYWTTLAKDGQITTISREETVSNVVTPSTVAAAEPFTTEQIAVTEVAEGEDRATYAQEGVVEVSTNQVRETVQITTATRAVEPTTFYTTYTYYTTSYAGDDTIINSRFETVTNIVTPTTTIAGRAIDLKTVDFNKLDANVDKTPSKSTFALPASIGEQTTGGDDGNNVTTTINSIVALNQGKIVDAEGISTIFYTTQTIGSTIDGAYTEVVHSTSSISIDEIKKALSTAETDSSTKTYKTGLVRLIEGTMIANKTTTLYQSKVIGTIIEGRYAQIIESTSSFLIEKTLTPSTAGVDISPTSTRLAADLEGALQTAFTPAASSDAIESSINESDDNQENQTDGPFDEDDEEDAVDENGRLKSRLTFSTRKRTFTPVIRPFVSRNRPQFAPKRKNLTPSSATIITRSDFTPTITATPAIKTENSRGRFSSARKSNTAVLSSSGNISGSSRRFSRPKSSASAGLVPSSTFPSGPRNRLSSSRAQIQPTSSYFGLSSRRGGGTGQRGSSAGRFSSAYLGNSRLRIKPTSTAAFDASPNSNLYTTQETDIEEESSTPNLDELNEESEGEPTTESNRRNQNPLLRFRRPPVVGKTPTRAGQVSARRNPLTQRTKTTTTTTTTTTTSKPRPRAFQRPPISGFQNRARPQSNLFPPRGLFRPQTINQNLENESKKTEEENEFGDDLDTESGDYEDEEDDEEEDEEEGGSRRRRDSANVKRRSKRQVDYGSRNFRNRFRRPTTVKNIAAEDRIDATVEDEPSTPKTRSTGRYPGRSHQKTSPAHTTNARVRPTKPSVTSRAQFTLREKDAATKPSRASNFRRPTTSGISTRRTSTTIGRPKAPRLKSYTNSVTESTYTSRSTSGRTRQTTSRGRSTTRSRSRTTDYQANDPIVQNFDGTITVTHHIPTEITIPVVNGKITEYKNVVTAKISTEIIGPNQYNTLVGRNGNSILVLSREDTIVNNNGATEVTQFVLHETPTTSIIFTPTTIRGRRTSFSHIIPSTVYDVENVVSTIQPQIAANAPLANILLSQLLLGNIGLQQQNLNPLIGLGAQAPVPGTPTTEFKTRTTTYVTTVTNEMSTVIPLTFRGKEILTTIVDSSVNVITATEFLTDTIVVTPTMAPVQQVNSFLLPLLLQQQAQAQQNPLLPLQNTALPQLGDLSAQQLLFQDSFQDLDTNRIHKANLDEFRDIKESEELPEQESYRERQEHQAQPATHHRKRHRKGQKHVSATTASPPPVLETSVITLYVSGRRPGEFSTVLSTVIGGPDSSLRKREVETAVEKSAAVDYEDFYSANESEIKEYLLPASNEIASSQEPRETQSLESVIEPTAPPDDGRLAIEPTPLEYGSQLTTPFLQDTMAINDVIDEGRNFFGFRGFTLNSPLESGNFDEPTLIPTSVGDEARYNLATRVMSNGVEVIVASDKSKPTLKQSVFRILPNNLYKPLTLAPSTLKDQMVLVMPSEPKNNLTISINPNNFVTKTCLTTYTYRTTYLQDGTTTVESREKVISNIATEERNYLKITPTASSGITLSHTPELAVGVFHTTYTYLNTIINGDLPIVISSRHTVTNTITGPEDYIGLLQPSEEATPVYETNTYYSKVTVTKTLKENGLQKVISSSNILTQVILTESLPPRSTSVVKSYVAFDVDETSIPPNRLAPASKTQQFVTYTYYDRLTDDDIKKPYAAALTLQTGGVVTKPIPSPGAIQTDYRHSTAMATNSIHIYSPDSAEAENTIHVYATKTYLTTFTYFTTLLKSDENEVSSTVVDSHTRVIENVITESIPNYMLDSKLRQDFSHRLANLTEKNAIVTMATLLGGQSLELTAMNMLKPVDVIQTANNVVDGNTPKLPENFIDPSVELMGNSTEHAVVDIENAVMDYVEAESENDEVYTDENDHETKLHNNNNTKVNKKTEFPMANLIGSLNLNGLTALGPVFNAMAGLIQSNLGSAKRNVTIFKHVTLTHPKHTAYVNSPTYDNELDQNNHSPIYIPVRGVHPDDEPSNFHKISQASPSSLHISPPEKWTADEKMNRNTKLEITLNKPTYDTPLLNGGIPISPGEVITANSDVIVGKQGGARPRVPFNTKLKNMELVPNLIPLKNYENIRGEIDKHFDTFIQGPPPLAPPQKYAQKQIQSFSKKNFSHQNPPPYFVNYPKIPLMQLPQRTKTPSLTAFSRDVPNNEILEIKRIPEVYSTDLPPVEIGFQNHHVQKVVNVEKPMLVNIKPSQMANVVIPHDNANSVLIIESSAEPHKSGQYFDEPSSYPNVVTGEEPTFDRKEQKLVLSNQQINLDSHVLSHNVDIHVPPITFKKENDFPHSTPIRGHILNESPFHMAHVNIHPTDYDIEVRLTPQHISLPSSYLQSQSLKMSDFEDEFNKEETSNSGHPHRATKNKGLRNQQTGSKFGPHLQQTQAVSQDELLFNVSPTNLKKTPQFNNQRYPVRAEFKGQEKPHPFLQHSFAVPKRPLPHVSSPGKPPQQIIPHFTTVAKPRPHADIPLKPLATVHSSENTHSPKATVNFPVSRYELEVAQPPQISTDGNFYQLSKFSHQNEGFDALSLVENATYDHRDDDYENEEGEVVQESNSLPVIPGQYLAHKLETIKKAAVLPSSTEAVSTATEITSQPTEQSKLPLTTTTKLMIPAQYVPVRPSEINNLRMSNVTLLSGPMLPPHRGRPFTSFPKARPRPSLSFTFRPTVSQGEKFKKPTQSLRPEGNYIHSAVDNLPNHLQMSLPINPKSDEKDGLSLTQTEAPFNPKYTKGPLKTTTKSDEPHSDFGNSPISVAAFTTIPARPNTFVDKDSHEEIFDFKESINPHNLGVISNLEDTESGVTTATLNYVERFMGNSSTHQKQQINFNFVGSHKNLTTVVPLMSKPFVHIRPLAIPPAWKTEEVMGLSPPPPPTSMSPPPISHLPPPSATKPLLSSHLSPPNSTSYNTISFSSDKYAPLNRPISGDSAHKNREQENIKHTTSRKPAPEYVDTDLDSVTSAKTPPSTLPTTSIDLNLKAEISTSVNEKNISTATTPLRIRTTTSKHRIEVGGANSTKISLDQKKGNKITPTPSIKSKGGATKIVNTTSQHTRPTHDASQMFNRNQQIPDEILILSSENSASNNPSFLVNVTPDSRRRTTSLMNITTHTQTISKATIPTKYITSTETLTVTTTKTTVVRSQGVPSTQTLTLTETSISTIIGTITATSTATETETQTHTLLQPTKVKISSMPEVKMTVTTIYSLPDYQNYPVYPNAGKEDKNDGSVLFVADSETILDELIINYEDTNETETEMKLEAKSTTVATTTRPTINVPRKPNDSKTTKRPSTPLENDSIFVVMTDQKNSPGLISINMSMVDGVPTIDTMGSPDYDSIPFDFPSRDEDHENKETNHVLLGGILIASPPKTSTTFDGSSITFHCKPDCKASRSELCQRINGIMRCVCRPGFARMFPDHPCKPTYTYSLSLPLHFFGKEVLIFNDRFADPNSPEFFQLARVTHDALDRMVMQSDFRDVYHGIHITSFERVPKGNGILGNFYLQLSDNSNENRLVDVFRKYLRSNNYSIGGTELQIAKSGVNELRATDFDECLDPQFHDCSENSQCFNLHGTYTCSCKEGYVDLSENPLYPGRKCSADLIGCEKCYYHGTCYTPDDMEQPLCECFHWYAGKSCQINLKILLIALIALGVSLLILLLFCVLVTCSKRHKARSMQSLMAGFNILPQKSSKSMSSHLKMDKRAMIKDSSSEASHNSDTLPYVSRKDSKANRASSPQAPKQRSVRDQSNTQAEVERRCNLLDQNDRSLTVMIPRAKYHPVLHHSPSHLNLDVRSGGGGGAVPSAAESKILSYLDAGGNTIHSKKIYSTNSKHATVHSTPPGALVSAGFEVSATVGGQDASSSDDKSHLGQKATKSESQSQYDGYRKADSSTAFAGSMDNWLDTMQQNELTISEARSYDETTIQAPTKSLTSAYGKQLSQINNDEANTMAERDVGSTFLLPHTHLYKPDRGSDVSGFDSF